jgi:hypothetical protein
MDLFALRLQECKVDIAAPAQNLRREFARATRRSSTDIVKTGVPPTPHISFNAKRRRNSGEAARTFSRPAKLPIEPET